MPAGGAWDEIWPLYAPWASKSCRKVVAKLSGWSCITWLRISTSYSRYPSATRRLKNHPMQGKVKDAGGRRLGVLAGSMSLRQCRGSSSHWNS